MGYDLNRFAVNIDEELKCSICCGVLEDPVQAKCCQHAFCRSCIQEWIKSSESCPIDRSPLCVQQIEPIPRIIRNLLNRLQISCDWSCYGCSEYVTIEDLVCHRKRCSCNPDHPVPCPKECGAYIAKNHLNKHDCVRDLRQMLCKQQREINELKDSLNMLTKLVEEQRSIGDLNYNTLQLLSDKYDHLNESIRTLEGPVREVLTLAYTTNTQEKISIDEKVKTVLTQKTTTEIYVSNIDRSVTPGNGSCFLSAN